MLPSRTNSNPTYGMPRLPKVGGNGVPRRTHEKFVPQYIRGLEFIPERNPDFLVHTPMKRAIVQLSIKKMSPGEGDRWRRMFLALRVSRKEFSEY